MKVLVTGATGLVGAHSALALYAAGHGVRLFVRNETAARDYFRAHGHATIDVATGDIRDADAVRRALEGCDAVLHAAAIVSLDARKERELIENNLAGTRAVVGGACAHGIRNVLYVSTLEVFDQHGRASVDEGTPLGNSAIGYSKSKRLCEDYVRDLQAQGHCIQITYPAGIIGPDDPKLSEANRAMVTMLSGMIPRTSTGMQCVDVRDLAQVHRYLLEHPLAGDFERGRYIVGGRYYRWADLHAVLQQVTARRIPAPPLPGAMLRGMGTLVDLARRVVYFDTQMTGDAMKIATQWVPADSSRIVAHAGIAFRDGAETFTDAVRWLAQAGHLKAKHAGALRA